MDFDTTKLNKYKIFFSIIFSAWGILEGAAPLAHPSKSAHVLHVVKRV